MKNKTTICPKCGSVDIKLHPDHLSAVIGITPIESQCKNCGYSSKFFPEIDIEYIEKFRKQLKNESSNI